MCSDHKKYTQEYLGSLSAIWFHPIYYLCYRVFCVISLQPTVGLASSCMGWEIAGMQRGNSCFPLLSVRVLYAHVSCHGQPLIHYGISLLIMLVSVYVCEVTHCLHRLLALLSYCCSCLHKGWLAACWDSREKLACVCMSSSEGRSLSSSGCCITIQDLGSWCLFTSQGLHGLNFLNCA